jgi:hypothetical protein
MTRVLDAIRTAALIAVLCIALMVCVPAARIGI